MFMPSQFNKIKHTPKVSIGLPVYNAETHIRNALETLLSQTYQDFELIISDNDSTDSTKDICYEYVARDSRIKYIKQKQNIGALANFQFVLSNACGEYFMWAASDDEWESSFIEFCLKNIGNSGSIMTAYKIKNRPLSKVTNQALPKLSGKKNQASDTVQYLKNLQAIMIYGLHKRSNILFFLKETGFDWLDCNFCLRLIHEHGYKTFNNVLLFNYCINNEQYLTKPINGRFCNPFPYYFKSIKYVVYSKKLALHAFFLHTKSLFFFLYRYTVKEFIFNRRHKGKTG